MARKKGGLGQAAAVEVKEDLLDSVFGAPKAAPKPETDTPPPAPQAAADKDKEAPKGKENRVGKYFLIDRDLAKAMGRTSHSHCQHPEKERRNGRQRHNVEGAEQLQHAEHF